MYIYIRGSNATTRSSVLCEGTVQIDFRRLVPLPSQAWRMVTGLAPQARVRLTTGRRQASSVPDRRTEAPHHFGYSYRVPV